MIAVDEIYASEPGMTSLRDTARKIFDRALADCNVEQAVARHVSVRGEILQIGQEPIDLSRVQRIRIVAVGKAARPMLGSLLRQLTLPSHCNLAGLLIAPEESPNIAEQLPDEFEFFVGGHPFPNQESFAGARAALKMLKELPHETGGGSLCFFLISGGASAMMELPLDPSISLRETASFHRALVGSGASITEINCVRKHFSAVKGGRLAQAAGNAMCRSLLLSDVPIGREDALGSGPTIPDTSTVEQCNEILKRYRLLDKFPPAVRRSLESEALVETPKPEKLAAPATVLLSSEDLAQSAANNARELGFFTVIDNSCDEWEYKAAASYLLDQLRIHRAHYPRTCIISTGEAGVALPASDAAEGRVGIGGRNQQFALYAATLLSPEDDPVAILSAGSDGIDGNSPAAGAIVNSDTIAGGSFHSALRALEQFNAYPFLSSRGASIVIGPSGNNLRDLRILISGQP